MKVAAGRLAVETDVRERLAAVRHHQLFFVGMRYRRRSTPSARRRGGRRGAARKPPPAPSWRPDPGWKQPPLFGQIPRDYSRLALALVLTGYVEGDVIRHTEIFAPLRALDLPVGHTITVLEEMGIFEDDSEPWTCVLRDGGPRSLPRREGTVWLYLNRVRPALLEWSNCYDQLREVTRDDVLTYLKTLHRHHRHDQLVALRALFGWAKRNGLIFRNPASRIKVGQYEYAVLQPLIPGQVDRSVAAATTPATRLILALAVVHAARVAQIATLMLDDVDLGNRRLTIAGRGRPLDDLTMQLLLDWLEHRHRRWPNTANLHLLINNQTANTTSRASNHRISAAMRGQDATLERLRVDRQLEEAMVNGPDPLHLAEVFGLDEKTAMRCAESARALLEQPAAQQSP
ncbi:hypothetical protein [Streptomyces sp. NPDC059708]|uniref:hypothetical protein n=1 Tax=Streptomyces sp. NPDC059708 TaxID=3346916 RepID=UPI0036BEB365